VGSANDGKLTSDVVFTPHAEATKPTVFNLPKHRLDDDYALLVSGLGGGCLHFAVHVLPQEFLVGGADGAGLTFFGLALARLEGAFGTDFGMALVDPAAVLGLTDHRQGLLARTGSCWVPVAFPAIPMMVTPWNPVWNRRKF
jgi:hypothetical protein